VKYLIIFLVLFSCMKKKSSPVNVLKSFIEIRFEKILDKEIIEDFLTGDLLSKFKNYSDDDYDKLFDKKLKFKNIDILHKNCEEKSCFITYIIKYKKIENNLTTLNAETKKIAQIIKVDDHWKISDVNNIKTYYQSKKELKISPK